MALANYTDLQAAISAWLFDRSDLTARIPDFISLAEADLNRRVKIRQNMTTTQLALSQGSASVSLPTGFLEDIELNYNDTAEALTKGSFNDIDRMQTVDSQADRPHLYAITDTSVIFDTEADQAYTLNLRYYKKWDIATDTTNWLLTNAPDVYVFGALAEAAMFTADRDTLALATQRKEGALMWVLNADSRTKSRILMVDPMLRRPNTFDIVTG